MPLYKIKTEEGIQKVERKQFNKEKELHNLVEKNIDIFFGMKFLETEYPIPNGRIDSLCIDESGTPVIIEYKKRKDLSAIIQGLFYINWLRTNRRTFEMIVREKIGKEITIDWRSPRLLIIAEEFDQKETSAINQINASVELIKYSLYEGLVSFENLPVVNSASSYSDHNKVPSDIKIEEEQISLENVLDKGSDSVKEIILKLREWIFSISDEIDERVKSSMISYYCNGKGLIWIAPINKKFKLHLRKGNYNNEKSLIKFEGWGGYPELIITAEQYNNEIEEYVKGIIKQAYEN